MLRILVEKEIRDIIGSTKFAIAFGVCAALIILTFYIGAARHELNMSHYQASQSEEKRSMEGLTDWFDLDGTRVFLPPQPLASLVAGIDNDINRTAHIQGRGDIPSEDSRYSEDPIFAIFRFLDLDFIFSMILSLFAVLLGYDTISGEKETGTLRLTFSNAIPKSTYIFGKLIGSFIALGSALLVAISIGILVMLIMNVGLTGEDWLRLMIIILAGFLFFGVFLTLSIFVSAMTDRSANSFLVLLIVWVMCVVVVPGTSVLWAARSVPVPSVDEMAYKKSTLALQLFEEFHSGIKNYQIPAGDDPLVDPNRQINKYIDSLSDIRDSKLNKLSSDLKEERHNYQKIQERLAFNIARISPVTSFSLTVSRIAGTSIHLKNRFYDEAVKYQQAFGDFLVEKTGMRPGGIFRVKTVIEDDDGNNVVPERLDISELPQFKFTNEPLESSLAAAAVDLGILVLFNLVFFIGAFMAFVRYDVR